MRGPGRGWQTASTRWRSIPARKILAVTDDTVILDRGRIVHADPSRSLIDDPTPLERHLGVAGGARS